MTNHHNFLAHLLYGSDSNRQEQISIEDRHRYARAILTIAAADGLSQSERMYFVNLARGLGMPDEVAESYAKYDPKTASLEELLAPIRGKHPVGPLIYDAIKVASVDGYSDQERKKVEQAADSLGMSIETVRTLEALVEAEASIRRARLAVFASFEV